MNAAGVRGREGGGTNATTSLIQYGRKSQKCVHALEHVHEDVLVYACESYIYIYIH